MLVQNAIFLLLQTDATEAVAAGLGHIAVIAVAHDGGTPNADGVADGAATLDFVTQFGFINLRVIAAVLGKPRVLEVARVFRIAAIENEAAPLIVLKIISRGLVCLHPMIILMWQAEKEFSGFFLRVADAIPCPRECSQALFIFFFTKLFIQPAIFFIPQSYASEAVSAPSAVCGKVKTRAVKAILAPRAGVAPSAVHAFVAKFSFLHHVAIRRKETSRLVPVAIHAFLAAARGGYHIAVLIFLRLIRVFGIDAVEVYERRMGDCEAQSMILFEKRFVEIEIPPVCERVPRIRAPDFLFIHGERCILTVNGDD